MKKRIVLWALVMVFGNAHAQEQTVLNPPFVVNTSEETPATTKELNSNGVDYNETFETNSGNWSTQKADNGTVQSSIGIGNPAGWIALTSGGVTFAGSASYFTSSSVTADRWLFTSAITLSVNDALLTWKERSFWNEKPDNYEVYITTSVSGATPKNTDFAGAPIYVTSGGALPDWTERTINLASLGYTAGQKIYIAWRHHDTNKYLLGIDDIKVASASLPSDLILGKLSTAYSRLPLRHAAGKISFSALVKKENAPMTSPAELNVTVNGTNYSGSVTIPASLGGVEQVFTAIPGFSPEETGEYTANFNVVSADDSDLSNNTASLPFQIVDYTFATDHGSFVRGVSANAANTSIGNIYELKVTDIVKSVSLAFETVTTLNFTVSIYRVNPADYRAEFLYTSQTFNRNAAAKYQFSEFVLDMPQQLDPGLYLFTVDQLTSAGIQIASDGELGLVYTPLANNPLSVYNTLGNIALRVNTQPTAPDLVITNISSVAYSQVPVKHVGALSASVKNVGLPLANPATLNVTVKNTEDIPVYSGSASIPASLGATAQSFTASPVFSTSSTGLFYTVFEAVASDGDGNQSDNRVVSAPFQVTEQTFANDNGYFSTGTGIGFLQNDFGHIFELKQQDVITGFTTAFKSLDNINVDFQFVIYKVNPNRQSTIGAPLFVSQIYSKSDITEPNVFKDYTFTPQTLPAGEYLFAIRQLTTGISVARDTDSKGFFYVHDFNSGEMYDASTVITNVHNLMLRINMQTPLSIPAVNSVDGTAVYPTVTQGNIHVKTSGAATIKIMDPAGRTLATYSSTGEREIALNYAKGIYFILVESNKSISSHKVILQK
jgi:hypothetical protein